MGYTFFDTVAGRPKITLERRNVRRILFGAVIMTLASIAALVVMIRMNAEEWYEKVAVSVTMYAVISAAFAGFAFHLLQSKRKKSELWLFQMVYMFVHVGFLLYTSFLVWSATNSLILYFFTVILTSCFLLYGRGEYALFAGIEMLLPFLLFTMETLLPEQYFGIVAVHCLAGFIAHELRREVQLAAHYRQKYSAEMKTA